MNATDALALSMLAVIFTGFAVIALLFLCMARNAARRDLELERLMHDAAAGANRARGSRSKSRARGAWERDGEWWKREG